MEKRSIMENRDGKQQQQNQTGLETARPETEVRNYEEGTFCPNCGGRLTGRKCKLFCETPGCGYLVTCSEF